MWTKVDIHNYHGTLSLSIIVLIKFCSKEVNFFDFYIKYGMLGVAKADK
jgi:hypothetical protein